jgi:hypothetical protein
MVVVACSLCWEGQESWEKLCGELCVKESTFVIEGVLERSGFEDIFEFYG